MYHSNVKCPSCCEGEHCMNNLNERNLELPNRRDSSVIQFIHSMNLNLKKKTNTQQPTISAITLNTGELFN